MTRCPRIPVAYPDPNVPIVANRALSGRVSKYHQHTDADWEIAYVSTGRADYRVGKQEWRLLAGEVLIIQPDEPHACLSWRGERYTAMFRETVLRAMPCTVRGRSGGLSVHGTTLPEHFPTPLALRPTLTYVLDQLIHECFGGDATKQAMCTALLAQFLLELARSAMARDEGEPEAVSPLARETIERLCDEVGASLDEPWTLDDLVKRSGYSATQLSVLFNRVTGLSPCQWLSQERVRQACSMLAHSEQSVTQIATQVGFGSRSQFHRAFRQVVGTTPMRYQSIVRHEERA